MQKRSKYTLEYTLRCSPSILFQFIATPSGLSEWFAEKVTQKENHFEFTWNGSVDSATMIAAEEDEYVVYKWDWMGKDEYFEFRIEKSPVTNETLLTITDFALAKEIADQSRLWDSQILDLKHRIGS